MMMILAQANWEAPAGIAAWVACAAFLLFFFNQSAKAWRNLKGRDPEPPNSSLGQSVQHLDNRVARVETDVGGIRQEMKEDRDANEKHISDRQRTLFAELKDTREKLEKRINRISIGVARLCGRMNVPMPEEDAEI